MQTIWPFKRHQWTDCNCFWINVVLNHCESVSIRKNLKSCILDFAAIFSPLNLTVTLWSRSNHGTRLPHGSSLLVSLTSFLPFPNFFYPTFFKMRPYIPISLKIWHFLVQKGWNDSVRSGMSRRTYGSPEKSQSGSATPQKWVRSKTSPCPPRT